MATRDFRELIKTRMEAGFAVCVGLDPLLRQIPKAARTTKYPREIIFGFNRAIVEATNDLVVAYKPNLAFYAAQGIEGILALQDTIEFIHEFAPDIPVIFDPKFGDIGNSNEGYVKFAFQEMMADAVTVNGSLGGEALHPFLECSYKGIFVLCRTSNPGAGEFQDLLVTTFAPTGVRFTPLYEHVAMDVVRWNENGNCGLVVGATYPEELARVRKIVGDDMPILIPGIGVQGGELEATVSAGANSKGQGMIINSSRGIIFASNGPDFAEAARAATLKLHQEIQAALAAKAQKGG